MRPEYQKIMDAAAGIDQCQFDQLSERVQMWSRNAKIQDEFFNRPAGVTIEQMKRELSQKYHTSESNIEKIAYEL